MVKAPEKILVIRLSSLGDILLTSPLIRLLHENYPNAQIDFLVRQEFKETIEHSPHINKLFLFDPSESSVIKENIKKENYDWVIDLQNNFRSRLLTLGLKANLFRFRKPTIKKLLLVKFKINLLKKYKSIAERYIEAVPYLNFDEKDLELEFFFPAEKDSEARKILIGNFEEDVIVGICPGSKHFTKRYPISQFLEVIRKLNRMNFITILLGGIEDEEICREISYEIPGVLNLQNNNNLYLTAALMKRCSVILTNDSGLMHLSSALKVPTVAILGSTVREFGFAPINEKSVIIENNKLNCRPCSHIGRSSCPKKHFACMDGIKPEKVVELIIKQISNE